MRAAAITARLPGLLSTQLVRTSSVYVVSNLLNSAAPFILLPVLTRFLTPAEFGTVAMFLLFVTLLDPLVGFSTASAVSRKYFDRDEIDFPAYIGTCLHIFAASMAAVSVALLLLGDTLGGLFEVPARWLWAALAISAGRYLVSLLLVLWQVAGRPWAYAALSFAQTAGTLAFSVWFVVGLHLGWTGRAFGEVASVVTLGLVALLLLVRGRWIRLHYDVRHARDAGKFGAGLVPHAYGALLIAAADRFLVTRYLGVDATGLYVVGAQIAMIITVLERSFNLAWAPWVFERLKRNTPEDHALMRRITVGYNISILVLALALGAGAGLVLGFLAGPAYAGSAKFVIWLALGAAFTGMYKMIVNPLFYYNKTHLLAVVTFATGAVNIGLTILLIRLNGALGAAQATAVSLLAAYILTKVLVDRVQRANASIR